MNNIAIFPGSFDPFTIGHKSIIERALPLFDKIIISIGNNSDKKSFYPLDVRKKWIEEIFKNNTKISVDIYKGLTVDYCKKVDAKFILRGLRTSIDFEYERAIGQMNKKIYDKLETIFILTLPEHSAISSTIVREIVRHNGDASSFVPNEVKLKI